MRGTMITTGALTREHAKLMEIAREILAHIEAPDFEASHAVQLRWRLAHALAVHLAKEDKLLYPAMKQHADRQLAAMATAFEREMGDLGARYHAHMGAWNGESIARDREAYRAETRQVMALLARRVEREERELYPLYEATRAAERDRTERHRA